MPAITYNTQRSGCYLGESAALNIINEEIIVASGSGVLTPGAVMGQITASKKYVPWDPALSNGAQTPAGILFHAVDATTIDVKSVATVNGPATINGNDLVFKAGTSDANKVIGITGLRARGLKVLPQHAS